MIILVRFTSQHALFAQHITFATRAKHSHVEFQLPDGNTIGCQWFGGVRLRVPSPKQRHVRTFAVEVDDGFIGRLRSDIGVVKYARWWPLAWLMRRERQSATRMICSGYVLARLAEQFHKLFAERWQSITPGELLLVMLDRFEEV